MAVPKHRRTSSSKRRRASHFALGTTQTATCPKCKSPVLQHRACPECGYYKGHEVVDTSRDVERTLRKAKEKVEVKEAKEEPAKEEKPAEETSSKA